MSTETIEQMGIRVLLAKFSSQILGEERVTGIQFNDGSTLDTDMIVISAGNAAASTGEWWRTPIR